MKKLMPLILTFVLTLSAFSQENTEAVEKNEKINQETYELLTQNETLDLVQENKGLILDDSETDWDIIKSIPKDAWALVKSPAGWDKKEWFIASGVVTMTTLIMVGDHKIQKFFQDNKTEFTKDVAYLAEMGGSQAQVGLAATYLVGTILKNPKLKKASVLAFSSLLVSGVLVQGLKQVFGRVRPYATDNHLDFYGPGIRSSKYNSFPSGHTTAAFAVASSISTVYDSTLVKILAYGAATLTGLSRVHDNKHWMSDVFMGAIIGTLTGKFITKRHMLNNPNSRVQVQPAVLNVNNQTGYGVSITISLDKKKKKKKKLY